MTKMMGFAMSAALGAAVRKGWVKRERACIDEEVPRGCGGERHLVVVLD
jgi:hypothetical protein